MQMISLVAAVAVDQRHFVVIFADATSFAKLTVRAPPGRQRPIRQVRRARGTGPMIRFPTIATKHKCTGPPVVARQDRTFGRPADEAEVPPR